MWLFQDGTICSWNLSGKLLHCVNCQSKHSKDTSQMEISANGSGDTEVKGQTGESPEPSALKRMVYDDHLNILAVIYFK